ncbi:hypothetical protein M422DRAFT_244458 [Sphaerobolus stellatus SS14]|nr:hypothetical protein M422DRAFT_244458 [Sphaerobolus stellatus SS14]
MNAPPPPRHLLITGMHLDIVLWRHLPANTPASQPPICASPSPLSSGDSEERFAALRMPVPQEGSQEERSPKKGRLVSSSQGFASAKRLGVTCGKGGTPREVSRISRIFMPDRVDHQLAVLNSKCP